VDEKINDDERQKARDEKRKTAGGQMTNVKARLTKQTNKECGGGINKNRITVLLVGSGSHASVIVSSNSGGTCDSPTGRDRRGGEEPFDSLCLKDERH
jgi:hypothetical protein